MNEDYFLKKNNIEKISIVSNSWFFARFETRLNGVWLVWGNPNMKRHNETKICDQKLRIIRDWLNSHFASF